MAAYEPPSTGAESLPGFPALEQAAADAFGQMLNPKAPALIASVRRFNDLFRARYRLTPRDLRRANGKGARDGSIRLTLAYRPPLAWEAMLHFLSGRAVAGVEAVVGRSYLRTVAVDGRSSS